MSTSLDIKARDPFSALEDAFTLVREERDRQLSKWGYQVHDDGTARPGSEDRALLAKQFCDEAGRSGRQTWALILQEEVAAALVESDLDLLRKELVQVATVALAWVDDINRRQAREDITKANPVELSAPQKHRYVGLDRVSG